jgi:hypothetical protein
MSWIKYFRKTQLKTLKKGDVFIREDSKESTPEMVTMIDLEKYILETIVFEGSRYCDYSPG